MDKHKSCLYQMVYQDLKSKIISGVCRKGEKLPAEFELMEQYSVSRDTIRKAIAMLADEYYVVRTPPKGTFVTFDEKEYKINKLRSFSEIMQDCNCIPSSQVLEVSLSDHPDCEVLDMLGLTNLHKVYYIARKRFAGELLLSLELVYLPYSMCPDIDKYITDKTSLFKLYSQLYGYQLKECTMAIRAERPTKSIAELLEISIDTPILRTASCGILENGTPLYYAICYYEGSKYTYKTIMSRRDTN